MGKRFKTKDLRLNLKLLFMPKALVRQVLIHELCHTEHLNHSQKFWALLKHPRTWLQAEGK
jgi:hypothetical protein